REVGVDIEYVRTNLECEQIAEHFFSAQEIADLKTVPDQEKFQVFFNCWTRKEAYIKAIGQGLSMPLDKFDVTLLPDEPARLVNTRPNPHEADRWLMRGLAPGAGYVGALVVEGRDWQHRCWEFPDDEF
ncbi:MAG: 4'-phosphopantetheinyl transferase superfamily protein, partial [Chloroflexota bacterium]